MSKKVKRTNKHHRKSRSRTGGIPFNGEIQGIPNVEMVDYKKHQSFHHLFQDTHPNAIAFELNRWWVDPEYVMVAVPRKEARSLLRHISQLTQLTL
jgi:hypothetical protein